MFEFVDLIKLNNDKNNYKYEVVLLNGNTNKLNKIKFGNNKYEDYTIHKDKIRQINYIKRHKPREKWGVDGINTRGFWSYRLIWKSPDIKQNLKDILDEFFN